MTVKELYDVSLNSFVFIRIPGQLAKEFTGSPEYADKMVRKVTAKEYPMYKSVLEVELVPAPRTIEIDSTGFRGSCIIDAKQPPYGVGIEHVKDKRTGLYFTIIQKGFAYYAYEERESGELWYRY